MKNSFIVLGKECENFDEIQTELLSDRKVFFIDYSDTEENLKGKYISIEDFDDIVANDNGYINYWCDKVFIKNPIIIKNNTVCKNLSKGDYNFYGVDEII